VTIVESREFRVVAEAIAQASTASNQYRAVRGLFHLPVVLGGEGARQTQISNFIMV